jgi:hypothetical protein
MRIRAVRRLSSSRRKEDFARIAPDQSTKPIATPQGRVQVHQSARVCQPISRAMRGLTRWLPHLSHTAWADKALRYPLAGGIILVSVRPFGWLCRRRLLRPKSLAAVWLASALSVTFRWSPNIASARDFRQLIAAALGRALLPRALIRKVWLRRSVVQGQCNGNLAIDAAAEAVAGVRDPRKPKRGWQRGTRAKSAACGGLRSTSSGPP